MSVEQRIQERRRRSERRYGADRRDVRAHFMLRVPAWNEQRLQFVMRYLFGALALVYFAVLEHYNSRWLSLTQLNAFFVAYMILNTVALVHARRVPNSQLRFRLTMYLDILTITLAVLSDPYPLPPSLIVFILVALGNGMRYGLRFFVETLVVCFFAGMVAMSLRFAGAFDHWSSDIVFLNLFGAIILLYSFILTRRYELNKRSLERHSRTDALTGLLNRRALLEVADELFEDVRDRERSLVVMFADLDKFKQINDTLGHASGDEVLVQFAEMLRLSIRGSDYAARYGGDEFVIILPDTDLDHAEYVAQRIQEQVKAWTASNGIDFSVTIGMGHAPTHGTDLRLLLEYVDEAMYRSKAMNITGGLERVREADIAKASEFVH